MKHKINRKTFLPQEVKNNEELKEILPKFFFVYVFPAKKQLLNFKWSLCDVYIHRNSHETAKTDCYHWTKNRKPFVEMCMAQK